MEPPNTPELRGLLDLHDGVGTIGGGPEEIEWPTYPPPEQAGNRMPSRIAGAPKSIVNGVRRPTFEGLPQRGSSLPARMSATRRFSSAITRGE